MSQDDLVTDLKQILNDSADKFSANNDADFKRHLDVAARDIGRVRPRTRIGNVTLIADQPSYPAPSDIKTPKYPIWGKLQQKNRKPWQSNYPCALPTMLLIQTDTGEELYLDPAPSADQIADLGSDYKFYYSAFHRIDAVANNTTVKIVDRDLLLIRATSQAMTELANHNVAKPVRLGSQGIGSMPKNGTPVALAEKLMDLFERMAA